MTRKKFNLLGINCRCHRYYYERVALINRIYTSRREKIHKQIGKKLVTFRISTPYLYDITLICIMLIR